MGHALLEHEEEADTSSLGSLNLVKKVGKLDWTYGGHPVVTRGHPTPQFRISIDKNDTGTSWTAIPQLLAQQHCLHNSSKFTLHAANCTLMLVDRHMTFLLSAQG
jgi:hypothetical protein